MVAAGIAFVSLKRGHALTEKDSILITDFVNTTADPVFDGTLKKALAVDLGQSPYLNVFPDQKIRQTLQFMGRGPERPHHQPTSAAKSASATASRPC